MNVDYLIVGTIQTGCSSPFTVFGINSIYRNYPDTAESLFEIIKSERESILAESSDEGFWVALSVTKHPHLSEEGDRP